MHEFKLHKVIYNISQFEEKLKILLKTYFDFNTVKNMSLGNAGYVRTQRILKFVILIVNVSPGSILFNFSSKLIQ